MKLLLTTLKGLEEAASMEARMRGLKLVSVLEPSLLIVEGEVEAALKLRTVDSVSEVLCLARVEDYTPRSIRSTLRRCFREVGEERLTGELRVKAWVRVRGVSRRIIELIAAREAERVFKVEANPRARSTMRIYLCADGTLLAARQLNTEPLHLRRYYVFKHPRALNPLLAAVIPILAPAESVYDPCCGSGTIPIEYSLAIRDAEVLCSDINVENVRGVRVNAGEAGACVEPFTADLFRCPLVRDVDLLATNPPRGGGVAYAYKYLRAVLRLAAARASKASLVTPYKQAALLAAERAKLRLIRDVATFQGGQRVHLLFFEVT
ncbi:MAG: hypothetical protein DRK00_01785 [Thermoprotei archaeon]|nr:MAG: hypothetical protein DRK00_01785 [Thermoprotei archaeon]